jgi:hypothetical protein
MRRFVSLLRHRLWRPIYLVKRLFSCPLSEKRLLLSCVVMLPTIALSLRFVRFQRVQAALAKLSNLTSTHPIPDVASELPEEIVTVCRCVRVAARQYRGAFTCLPQALLLWWLLRRRGLKCELRLGARRTDGVFEAHAWVEYSGRQLEILPEPITPFVPFEMAVHPKK